MMDAIGMVGEIASLGQAVYAHALLVKANQEQCKRLAGRIQIVVKSVQDLDVIDESQNFCTGLSKMRETLEACLIFVDQFKDKNWFKKVLRAGAYKDRFEELTQDVHDASQDLNLGLTAQQIINRDQDREDQKNDMNNLRANQAQIIDLVEGGLKEQQKGHQYLEAMRLEKQVQDELLLKQLNSVRERLDRLSVVGPVSKLQLDPKFEIQYFDFEFEEILAEGNFGTVYAGRWQSTPVSIKAFSHPLNEKDYQQFIRETQIASRLRHPNITQFLGACLEKNRACLVMEKMDQGSLYDAIQKGKFVENPELQKTIILDIARGLAYLHSKKIFHRNLNCHSILLDQLGKAKLSDFGFAKLQTQSVATLQVGVTHEAYLAPELFRYKEKYTAACDLYSFGYLIWAIFTGKEAFQDFKGDLIAHIRADKREVIPNTIPEFYAGLIRACWRQEPKERPQLTQFIEQVERYTPRPASPSPEAVYEQGLKCESRKDERGAFMAYQRASDKGFFKAHTNLATFFLQGSGGALVDKPRAHRLLTQAAEDGHFRAQHNLATLFANGVGTEKDVNQAIFWYQQAGVQGDTRAQQKADMLSQTFSMQGNLATRQ